MKILIVDDVQFMLTSLSQLLERSGYAVVMALDGQKGLELLSTDFTIDVVITDLVMPEMSGLEFYRRAQTIERVNDDGNVPAPPFVLLTSFDKSNPPPSVVAEFREAKRCFAGILHKPVNCEVLTEILRKIEHKQTDIGRVASEFRELIRSSLDRIPLAKSERDIANDIEKLQQALSNLKISI